MIRLHFIVEGRTEEKFVNDVLAPHLVNFNVFCDARCVRTSKDNRSGKQYKGGLTNYQKVKNDIERWLKEDASADCRFTTMFDLYALPNSFPEYIECQNEQDKRKKVERLEAAFKVDINDYRFIPYIQLHELESLIFADPQKLEYDFFDCTKGINNLIAMLKNTTPEQINDGAETAPSKRILKEIPDYQKVISGVNTVKQIGLPTLREKCPHFGAWLTVLENLATEPDKEV